MDIGVCVLKVILEMRNTGVYGSEFIKKRRFWPREVHRDGINEYCSFKNGDVEFLSGEWDEMKLIFLMKEPDCNIMVMLKYLILTVPDGQKEERKMVNGEVTKLKYAAIVAKNYRYREEVEIHNESRHVGEKMFQNSLENAQETP